MLTLQKKGNHKKTISMVGTQIEIQIILLPNKKHTATSGVVVGWLWTYLVNQIVDKTFILLHSQQLVN
jgi:hypothetical protein